MIRLYGRAGGNGSHARVTAGFRLALEAAGILDGCVWVDQERLEGEPAPAGALAPWALHTGPLGTLVQLTRNARHEHRVAMVAPNSNRIPQSLAVALHAHCTELLAPSDWAADVLTAEFERYGHPMHVTAVPHGVDPEFRMEAWIRNIARRRFAEHGAFDVLHFSTSERQRKGTLELVEGWRQASEALPRDSRLWLVLDPLAADALNATLSDRAVQLPSRTHVVERADASVADMRLMLSSAHLVCQPSRGEAFGLVPVEALACGVPVAATSVTGHSEHVVGDRPGVIVIGTAGEDELDDMEGATAPVVQPEAIAQALQDAAGRWRALDEQAAGNADEFRDEWQWQRQLAPWLENIRAAQAAEGKP